MRRLAPVAMLLAACAAVPEIHPPVAHLHVHGGNVPFYAPAVLSVSDDNRSYLVTLETTLQPGPLDFHDFDLECEGAHLKPYFVGDNEHSGFFAFRADAIQARTMARALGVSVTDRRPWAGKLVGRLELKRDEKQGAPGRTLLYRLSNAGEAPGWVNCGGHMRPALGRDPRFMMEIEPEGQPFLYVPFEPEMGAPDHVRLGPGESRTFELDPSDLCSDLRPGRYTIRATFNAEYYPVDWDLGQGPVGWEEHITHRQNVTAEVTLDLR